MRLEVVTNNKMISLGIFAKDIFLTTVCEPDKDNLFDALQEIKPDTLEKVKNLPVKAGITKEIKDGIIKAFSDMKVGEKFLCINDWVVNYESKKAKYFWKVQELCNKGYSLKEAEERSKKILKKEIV